MRRIATSALLAALLLAGSSKAPAYDGPGTYGLGCSGWALYCFPHIHQHGPLFNYGPYYGYPPFEPYGYWNAYLHYTGPDPATSGYGGGGQYGWIHGGYPHVWGSGNPHPLHSGSHHPGLLHRGGCSSCGLHAANYVNSGDAVARYSGHGAPAASAAYYAETPNLLSPGGVLPAGFPTR
jgi:hypothetical protein